MGIQKTKIANNRKDIHMFKWNQHKYMQVSGTILNKLHKLHRTQYSSMMPAIIAKSCNILIGKTYWKSASLPAILHGTEAIYLSNIYIVNLQKEENKALSYIVNARRNTAISALRGEFGISLQSTRDMESQILFF